MPTARVIVVDPDRPDREKVREAAVVLRDGGLVAFPTETVYGLGADALSAAAVGRIFAAKGRPATDPVIVHVAGADELERVARAVPASARTLASAFWPGPLTLILHKAPAVPDDVTAGLSTVGVRVPSHAVARMLLEEADVPVAAPSANRFSRPSPTRADHVLADLGDRIDLVLDGGATPIGVESTILDLTVDPPIVRRPGGVPIEAIRRLIPGVHLRTDVLHLDQAQRAPGQLLRHYAPTTPLTLYVGSGQSVASRLAADVRAVVASGRRVGVLAPAEDLLAIAPRLAAVGGGGRVVTRRCGSRADPDRMAHDLFDVLRGLDAEGLDVIFASAPEARGLGAAIIDRLTRAAEGRVVMVADEG